MVGIKKSYEKGGLLRKSFMVRFEDYLFMPK